MHADAAFAASFREAMRESRESWLIPAFDIAHYGSQKESSYRIDEAIHKRLVASAPTQRERQPPPPDRAPRWGLGYSSPFFR